MKGTQRATWPWQGQGERQVRVRMKDEGFSLQELLWLAVQGLGRVWGPRTHAACSMQMCACTATVTRVSACIGREHQIEQQQIHMYAWHGHLVCLRARTLHEGGGSEWPYIIISRDAPVLNE